MVDVCCGHLNKNQNAPRPSLLFLTFSVLVANPKKLKALHGKFTAVVYRDFYRGKAYHGYTVVAS